MGRQGDARKVIDGALKKNAKNIEALRQRAELLALQGKYTEAESDLNQVLRPDPQSAETHYLLAKMHRGVAETRAIGRSFLS
jgi:tetratricopeptide (TPR) repeat protein